MTSNAQRSNTREKNTLTPYLSPLGAWALSLGTAIGWGSMIVTSNSYLLQAGPMGSVIGILIGAAIMIVISRNYHYMITRYPEAGGAYAYAREAFGYDYGFLIAWFLVLAYAAIFWANASSLPLFSRFFMGDIYQFGHLYTIFGYDVYVGEILLTIAFIVLTAIVTIRFRNAAVRIVIVFAILMTAMITVCFAAAMAGFGGGHTFSMDPAMLPEKNRLMQVIFIASISPWAFIGFENISHAAEEFTFPRTKAFRIMVAAVITSLLLYIFLLLLSVSAYPPEYSSWMEYLKDLDSLEGIKGLPPFYAAHYYMGNAGVAMLLLALLGLVFTSLIGNVLALSRLLYAMAKDGIIPGRFTKISRRHTPSMAIMLIAVISLFIPFIGRTAIGWIVDVTTLGATIVYGFVSASVLKVARKDGDRVETRTGAAGLVLMFGISLELLLPNLFSSGNMSGESYLLFSLWAILGFVFFRNVLRRDGVKRFGRSVIVWGSLLVLIFFACLAWLGTESMKSLDVVEESIEMHYDEGMGNSESEMEKIRQNREYTMQRLESIRHSNRVNMGVVTLAFAAALIMLLSNYTMINRKIVENELALATARTRANTDPLTGVKSKMAFVEAEAEMNDLLELGEELPFAIAVCDMNGLKEVNDTQGHRAGDEMIKQASRMISTLFKHSPVFRTGGDEFAVILTGGDYEKRQQLMQALHDMSEENIGKNRPVVSGGISDFDPEQDRRVQDVFERADNQMYQEKVILKGMEKEAKRKDR